MSFMKRVTRCLMSAFIAVSFLSGCASSQPVSEEESQTAEVQTPPSVQQPPEPKEISDDDLKRAIQQAVRSLLRSGVLDNPNGGRYVVTVSRVANLSKAPLDTEEAVRRIQANLAVGKKVRVVLADNAAVSPEINVSARITQRTAYVRSGKRIEYYLHLTLTEIKSGIVLGENVTPILKRRRK